MADFEPSRELLQFIVDRVNVGIFIVDASMEIRCWNRFMATNSGLRAEEVVGSNLFECFPDLPQRWLEKKIESVFMLKNFAFISWEQRPYLFKFPHNRPVTGGVEYMNQDFTLMPLKNAHAGVDYVCIILQDVTDVSIYQRMLKDAMGQLEQASRVDGLTQLANRSYWQQRLSEEFARRQRYGEPLTVIMFDLDHFKSINDTYGHLAGDEVLKTVAQRLQGSVREQDMPGRYGGEEFAIILPSTDLRGGQVVAERIRKAVACEPIEHGGVRIPISVSLGLAECGEDLEDYESLLSRADDALYHSKEGGRNQWTAYSPSE